MADNDEKIPTFLSDPPPSLSKPRKKRKWDQPHESLISCGVVTSGMLPMSTVGYPVVSLPAGVSTSSALSSNFLKASHVNSQAPLIPQQAALMVQKLIQPMIQEDLIIAREIVINDADPVMRYKLTKRQTQEEIQNCTGAVVITRGKYRPPNAVPDGEKPLYLHISSGAHIKETAERILAVDRAAAMVEDMLKQVSQPLSTCIYVGFDPDPSLNITARIRGPNDQYINHIINETGAAVVLRGRGSGYLGSDQGEEGHQPLHLFLSSNNQKSLEDARLLAENLLDTICGECGATRVSSCKLYGAVPPPQQLLGAIQSSVSEMNSNFSSAGSLVCSAATCVPVSPVVAPVVTTAFPYGVAQPAGVLSPGHTQTNGLLYSQPLSTARTSYSVYAGVYPQASPLQQVALALKQSSTLTSTVTPATSATGIVQKSPPEAEKRPPQKRKFQESPAALIGVTGHQGSGSHDPLKSSSIVEKKNDTELPRTCLKSLPPPPTLRSPLTPFLDSKSMPPPPPPPKFCSPTPSPVLRSLPPQQPPTKSTSSLSVNGANDTDNFSNKVHPTAIPDTLINLLEYGDDDDDEDDAENENISSMTDPIRTSKPFWAVK